MNQEFCYKFTHNKPFGILIDISSSTFIFLETFTSAFSHVNTCVTDINSVQLELEDKINLTLIIN